MQFVGHYLFTRSVQWFLVILLVPMIFLNFIKSLKYLTPASLIASILTVSGLGITFFYLLQGLPRTSTVDAFASWATLPLYFGTAIYAFEGISLVCVARFVIQFSIFYGVFRIFRKIFPQVRFALSWSFWGKYYWLILSYHINFSSKIDHFDSTNNLKNLQNLYKTWKILLKFLLIRKIFQISLMESFLEKSFHSLFRCFKSLFPKKK